LRAPCRCSVIGDIMGVSGRRMIEAMIAGEPDPHRLAALAERNIKASPQALHDALHGRLREQHRFLLKLHLQQWDALVAAIRQVHRELILPPALRDEARRRASAGGRCRRSATAPAGSANGPPDTGSRR
jgi:hypothetical protein